MKRRRGAMAAKFFNFLELHVFSKSSQCIKYVSFLTVMSYYLHVDSGKVGRTRQYRDTHPHNIVKSMEKFFFVVNFQY